MASESETKTSIPKSGISKLKPESPRLKPETSGPYSKTLIPNSESSALNPQDLSSELSSKEVLKKTEPCSFPKRLDFLKYLHTKDPLLKGLVEQLSLTQKSARHFCFKAPEKFSYLYNKIQEPSKIQDLENYLKDFLDFKDEIKVEILCGDKKELVLKEEQKQKEKRDLFQMAQENAFVKEVKALFQAEVKRLERKP